MRSRFTSRIRSRFRSSVSNDVGAFRSSSASPPVPGIAAPTLTITGGTTDTSLTPELNGSAYTQVGGNAESHASTDWQISDASDFSNIVWEADDSASLTQITVSLDLEDNTTYYARVRYNSTSYVSDWSAGVEFNTVNIFVTTPSITSPSDAATDIGETPTITSSAFAVTGGSDTHASSDWQIASDSGFNTIVVQSLDDASNLESWDVPSGNLQTSTTYYVRVRHTGTDEGDSAWSTGVSFTTAAAFGWDLSSASYSNVSFSVASQESNPTGVAFSSDGTKMFVLGIVTDTVYQYTLSSAWDLSSASYDSVSFSVASQDTNPTGIAFSSDGTKMFVTGNTTPEAVYQYTLSSAWDLSSASYNNVSLGVNNEEGSPSGIAFSSDGTKMFVVGFANDAVHQYTLSSAWDLSSASYDSVSFSVASQDAFPRDVAFDSDGTKMFVVGNVTDSAHQYTL